MPNNSSAVSDDASSGSGSGGSGGCGGGGGGSMLKKGPWTAAEDAILMEYVKKHGEGNWNAVQKNSGLSRCGKSCRLRWANHLRPNLKKGSFSPEEERLILELHSKLGNKWARMAAQLPGRTDNEIKNYWNTRVKRRLRSGLPLYPQEIERQAAVYHMQQSNHHHQPSHLSSPSPSSPLPFSSLHHQKPNFGSQSSFFDPINFSSLNRHTIPQSQVHHGYKRFRGSNVGFTNPFSTPSSSSSSTSTLLNQNFTSQLLPPPHLQFNSTSFELNPPPPILRPFEPDAMVPPCSSFSMKLELPSSQLPQPVATVSAASTAAVLGISNDLIPPTMARSNSGLLDDMLKEAQAMESEEEGRREGILQSQEEKDGLDGFLSHAPCGSVFSESPVTPSLGSARHWDGSSSAHSSMGVKMKKEQPDEINSLDHDDDLSSFFNIGPSTLLVSDLYNDGSGSGSGGGGEMSNGQSSVVTDEDIGLEMPLQLPPSSSLSTTTATAAASNAGDHDWTIDAWNNMPEMC